MHTQAHGLHSRFGIKQLHNVLKVTVLATCTNDSVVTNSTQALQVLEACQVAIGACNKVNEG